MSDLKWVEKIQLDVAKDEEGMLILNFSWDDTDPDLKMWTDWGEEKQKEFVLAALEANCRDI